MDYQGRYTGPEIDSRLEKAGLALTTKEIQQDREYMAIPRHITGLYLIVFCDDADRGIQDIFLCGSYGINTIKGYASKYFSEEYDEYFVSVSPTTIIQVSNLTGPDSSVPFNFVDELPEDSINYQAICSNDVLAVIRANEDNLLSALKQAGKISDYTIANNADSRGVFEITIE